MKKKETPDFAMQCPIPISKTDKILLAHGSGGLLTHQLIQKVFLPAFQSELLNVQHDGAIFTIDNQRLAFTTDSYVVQPIFFPGGDIGKLAVNGTVNDLSVCGAKPLYISTSFIIEEGFPMEDLYKIVKSIKAAAQASNVEIVTGDTKVVEHGKGDKIFINTSGIGKVYDGIEISPGRVCKGDVIILSGSIADHGIAILAAREELGFETTIESDTASLNELVENILICSKDVHMMRDPTRGGLSSALNEIAEASQLGIEIDENKIPIKEEVKGACELLGFDPLYIANEGKLLVFVPKKDAENVLRVMRLQRLGKDAVIIGGMVEDHPGVVVMKTLIGSKRIVDMLSDDQLPRIC
ncbi:MAG: hydrogenase expression/formation protein HypE [Ignavibacteriales bacterium]|nr:hydrogenase expression/formation protein HypE [Ignavibacteriales bacterium]